MSASTKHTTLPVIVAATSDTSTFHFDGMPVRVITRDGTSWFVTADLCAAVGTENPSAAMRPLDPSEKITVTLDAGERMTLSSNKGQRGGARQMSAVSEGGMYTIILRARSATTPGSAAHRFRRFVTDEVLPAIRRTGAFATAPAPAPVPTLDLDDNATLRRLLMGRIERVDALEALVDETSKALTVAEVKLVRVAPMVDAYHAFLSDEGLCNLRTAARAIGAPCEPFFDWIKERGWVIEENKELQPNAKMRRDGYMVLRARGTYGGKLRESTMVTRAGLAWLRLRWRVGPEREHAVAAAEAIPQHRLPGV